MRLTKKSGDKWIVPKQLWEEAAEKLARLEDAEHLEDVMAYCLCLNRAAKEKERTEPEIASLLGRAADEIVNMSNFRDSAAALLAEKQEKRKKELLAYIDEVDGYIADDPVSLIREKVEELL